MGEGIKITPELDYQVKLSAGFYSPAILKVEFGEDGKGKARLSQEEFTGISYFIPENENNLIQVMRSIDTKFLKHLKFPNIEKESPKVFIHRSLADSLGILDILYAGSGLIKPVSKIKDYEKYFEIFKDK